MSVEDSAHASRIAHLKQINSEARFISFEPLLGAIGDVDLRGISWAIVGGESGPRARAMEEIFLLVPQVKLPKRLNLARDADRALDSVPGLIVTNWVETRF